MTRSKTLDREAFVRELLLAMRKEHNISADEIKQALSERELTVPVTIFNIVLSPFEAIVTYLRDRQGFRNAEIARMTGRDPRAVGVTYRRAKAKMPIFRPISTTEFVFPVRLLADKRLSVFEHIVKHLKENYKLRLHEIARVMHRDDRTVWTIYKRSTTKKQ